MERVIGVLGSLVKQSSGPSANLTHQAKKVAGINALQAMWPEIGHGSHNPRGSIDLGGGYILLGPKNNQLYPLSPAEQCALATYYASLGFEALPERSIYRWARLQIPNGQPTRSRWKEVDRASKPPARTDQMVKVSLIPIGSRF